MTSFTRSQLSRSQKSSLALVGGALIVLLALTERPVLQLTAALVTCLVLPGLGWARKLRTGDRGDTFALTLVISICATVLVSTAMAVSAHWSPVGGLAALAGVTLAGFVPYRQLAARAGAVLPAPVPVDGRRVAFVDWYADARRRSAEQREAVRAAAAESSAQWQGWYANRHLDADAPPPHWDDSEAEPAQAEVPSWELVATASEPASARGRRRSEPVESDGNSHEDSDDDFDLSGVGESWSDWYAAARSRDDAASRKAQAARAAEAEWRDWYRRAAKDAGH